MLKIRPPAVDARRSVFSFSAAGRRYPGLSTSTKTLLWKTIGAPSLTFGLECQNISHRDISARVRWLKELMV
jgi:hypothetical protein